VLAAGVNAGTILNFEAQAERLLERYYLHCVASFEFHRVWTGHRYIR